MPHLQVIISVLALPRVGIVDNRFSFETFRIHNVLYQLSLLLSLLQNSA